MKFGTSTIVVVLIMVVLGAAFLTARQKRPPDSAMLSKNLDKAEILVDLLRRYAVDNEGSFPKQMSAIYPKYTDTIEVLNYWFEDGDTTKPQRFVYHSGLTEASYSLSTLLQTEPNADGEMIVVYVDGPI